MAHGVLRRFARQVGAVLAPETLEDASREELPEAMPAPDSGKKGFLSWLLGPESLPLDPPADAPRRPSFLGMLLSPESLPEDPAPRRAGGAKA